MRGATITVDPTDKVTPLDRVPLLVRSKGAEIGVAHQGIPGLDSPLALFVLDFDSELLFVGDAGTTEASRPSRRIGVEWTNHCGLRLARASISMSPTRTRASPTRSGRRPHPWRPAWIAAAA